MKRDVSTTAAAARAINARNPVTFDCVHSLEESIRRLAAVPKLSSASVDAQAVRIAWEAVRFEGRWIASPGPVKLEGTMVPHGVARKVLVPFGVIAVTAAMSLLNGAGWGVAIMGLVVVVAIPLFAAALGSARIAAEIELERIIGQAIGDPEKYKTQWRKWRED